MPEGYHESDENLVKINQFCSMIRNSNEVIDIQTLEHIATLTNQFYALYDDKAQLKADLLNRVHTLTDPLYLITICKIFINEEKDLTVKFLLFSLMINGYVSHLQSTNQYQFSEALALSMSSIVSIFMCIDHERTLKIIQQAMVTKPEPCYRSGQRGATSMNVPHSWKPDYLLTIAFWYADTLSTQYSNLSSHSNKTLKAHIQNAIFSYVRCAPILYLYQKAQNFLRNNPMCLNVLHSEMTRFSRSQINLTQLTVNRLCFNRVQRPSPPSYEDFLKSNEVIPDNGSKFLKP